MKKILNNKLWRNYLIISLFLFLLEITFRLVSKADLFNYAVIRIFISTNILGLLLSFILCFIKNKNSNIVIIVISSLFTIYAYLQLGFNSFIGNYMSFNTSSQLGAVKSYIVDFFSSFNWYYYFILVPLIIIVLYYVFIDKKFNEPSFDKNKWNLIIPGGLIAFLGILYFLTLIMPFMQNKYQTYSNKDLFHYPEIQSISVNQFGITMYGFLDFKTLFMEKPSNFDNDYEEQPIKEETDNTRKIDDTNFKDIIANETNIDMNTLNNYFISRNITDKNDMTGYFKGKNVIVMLLESANMLTVNEKYFPTLAKMYNEGWSYVNNYSPRNSCSTGNNEMSAMISLYAINNSCTANTYRDNTYYESIFNLFNKAGYNTSSYHDYSDWYYYRNTIHKNMYSGKFYDADALNIAWSKKYKEWPSDVDLMNNALDTIDTTKPFMAFMSTVTTHQPYGVSSAYGDKYLDDFADLDVGISLKRYLSKVKELDLAMETLLNKLQEKGILDDTVIVMFGDHYPYGISTSELQKMFDYDIAVNKEIDKTPFIIYNSKLTGEKFEKYTTFMNITPTIANLFDLDYDPRLYMGNDLFSSEYPDYAVFPDGSWQNAKAFYNAGTGEVIYKDNDNTMKEQEVISINNNIDNMIKMSNSAIRENYFNYLENAFAKYNITSE